MWDLPGPGIEPVSPALAGGFLTTVPPGKSQSTSVILAAIDVAIVSVKPNDQGYDISQGKPGKDDYLNKRI